MISTHTGKQRRARVSYTSTTLHSTALLHPWHALLLPLLLQMLRLAPLLQLLLLVLLPLLLQLLCPAIVPLEMLHPAEHAPPASSVC